MCLELHSTLEIPVFEELGDPLAFVSAPTTVLYNFWCIKEFWNTFQTYHLGPYILNMVTFPEALILFFFQHTCLQKENKIVT